MSVKFNLLGETHDVGIAARRPDLRLSIGGQAFKVVQRENGIEVDGVCHTFTAVRDGNDMHVRMAGRNWVIQLVDPRDAAQQGAGENSVVAPMPGLMISLEKQPGEQVSRGEPVVTIESMKLQLTLEAPRDGTIGEIFCAVGDSFVKGATLFAMTEQEDAT